MINRTVFKARDIKTNEIIALKKIRFNNLKEGVCKLRYFSNNKANLNQKQILVTAIREINLLKQLHHDNIIKFIEIVTDRRNFSTIFHSIV